MTPSRKPPVRPSKGNPLRKRADEPRKRYLIADFTDQEKDRVIDYCLKHKISVSQFLADVALQDAKQPSRPQEEDSFTVKLPSDKMQKLAILARLKQTTIDDLIQELLLKAADATKQPVSNLKTQNLSYYLTAKEHHLITKHVEKKGVSARNYVATLALDAIAQEHKKKPK